MNNLCKPAVLFGNVLMRWIREEKAVAATEAALLFPVMISLLMGVYDIGNGIVVNQKALSASQVMADLIARNQAVDMDMLSDIVIAGRLAMEPIAPENLGYDIASVQFDDDENPVVQWRLTNNMAPNEDAVTSTELIADAGEGVVIVSVAYTYTPFFSHFIVDSIQCRNYSSKTY